MPAALVLDSQSLALGHAGGDARRPGRLCDSGRHELRCPRDHGRDRDVINLSPAAGRDQPPRICVKALAGIMLPLRWYMTHIEPKNMSETMSTPKARASALLVLSGEVVRCRKKTRCTPTCARPKTMRAMTIPGP